MRVRNLAGLLIVSALPFTTGCAGMSKTAQGAGIGGGIGAASGALIGKATNGKAGQGALIGGLIGAGVGGMVGNEEDRRDKEALERRVASRNAMSVRDVIELTQKQMGDDVIINQMRTTGATFQLTTDDLTTLQTNGVSAAVIREMQNRRPDAVMQPRYVPAQPTRVIYAPAPPPEVIVVPAPPQPPPGFAVGVQIRR